jgi:hypothetical protein
MVPKQVVQRVPLSYIDPFSAAITSGYSSFSNPVTPAATVNGANATAPDASLETSILQPNPSPAATTSDAPQTRMQKIEMSELESIVDLEAAVAEETETVEIEEELLPPAQNGEEIEQGDETTGSDAAKASKAGWKIYLNPLTVR